MKKEYKFREIIEGIIDDINSASRKAKKIHKSGDIREAGDEIEEVVRNMIDVFLPERYLVKKGHIINSSGLVSPQFDVLIFDRSSTPKFFESSSNSVYYPIESVLAIGEIKLTLRSKHLLEFSDKIKYLKLNMKRKLIENTAFGGLKNNTLIRDISLSLGDRRYLNPLFSFVFAVDVENFDRLEVTDDFSYMPNSTYILNYGSIYMADVVPLKTNPSEKTIALKLEDEHPEWHKFIKMETSNIVVLASLFEQLINQLNLSYVEPFDLSEYLLANPEDFATKGDKVQVRTIKSRVKKKDKD